MENKVSLSETRCAELAMEVDELTAHLKVNVPALVLIKSPISTFFFFIRRFVVMILALVLQ